MKRMRDCAKRISGILLNLVLLLSIIPTLVYGLLVWIYLDNVNFSLELSLDGLNYSITALVVWHVFVWEMRIKIRRQWKLFLIRATKAIWMCSAGLILILFSQHHTPPRIIAFMVPFIIGGAVYAGLRHLFAPRYRI